MAVLSDVGLYVPARNAEATLGACLDAVGNLDPAPASVVVVVDPRSRDRTVELARNHPPCEVVVQTRPGLTAARNMGWEALNTPWVASVDADVMVAEDWLGELAAARPKFPSAVGISGRTEEHVSGVADLWRALMHPHHWGRSPMLGPFMIVSEALMRRSAFESVGGYRESLTRYGDDSRLSRDLRDAGYELAYTPRARAAHVRDDDEQGVLDLRWDYGAPRMGAFFDDLAGLERKAIKNVEFARVAVSRGIAAGAPQMALLGALLPAHHALRDLDAMLRKRRVAPEIAAAAKADLGSAMLQTTTRWPALAALAVRVLQPPEGSPKGLVWPRWPGFVGRQSALFNAWISESYPVVGDHVPEVTGTMVKHWRMQFGANLHPTLPGEGWIKPRSISPWDPGPPPTPVGVRIEGLPAEDAHPLYQGRRVTLLTAQDTRPVLVGATEVRWAHDPREVSQRPGVVSIPCLSEWRSPRRLLREVLGRADGAVIRYRPPRRLGQGEVLMAGDVAEACAEAGLSIAGFETHVADTIISARRQELERSGLAA